jgi:putative heme iron utilization protein
MTLDTDTDHNTAGATPQAEPIAQVTPAPRPTAAEAARTLADHQSQATLSTLAIDPAGHPFGSVAPYALLGDGTPVVFISALAEHTRNLTADPRASLLIATSNTFGDPMDAGRVTLLGTASKLADHDVAVAKEHYLSRHPRARAYINYGDFSFWTLRVEAVRWVGGFGRMAWCDPDHYRAAQPDPIVPIAEAALRHLNDDHADALLDMARALTGHPDANRAQAVRVDRYGIDLDIITPRGPASVRAPFTSDVTRPGDLRAATVALTAAARKRFNDD